MRRGVLIGLLLATGSAWALDDPMRPPEPPRSGAAERRAALRLTSVVFGRERRVAVINGERVTIGSRVGGAKVVAISPSQVTLQRGEKRFTLSLPDLPIKQVSKARE